MRVVLGTGPVGLISAYLLRADLAVGEVLTGNHFLRIAAPSHLWRTPETERLLRELDLPLEPETVRFGWMNSDGGISDAPLPGDRERYFRRSRRWTGDVAEVPRSVASSGKAGGIETFAVSVNRLCEVLAGRVRGNLLARVETVRRSASEDAWGVFAGSKVLRATHLVNTLPAPVWDSLLPGGKEDALQSRWSAGPKCWVVGLPYNSDLRKEREAWLAGDGRAFLYVADPRVPFDRVTFLREDALSGWGFSYEFNAPEPPAGFRRYVDGRRILSGNFQIDGPPRPGIEFGGSVWHVGRMARWEHRIRLHDVVKELYEVRDGRE